jgi:hypothetical protein
MKLLAMRNREFHDRKSSVGGFSRRRSTFLPPVIREQEEEEEDDFAPVDEEVQSMGFLLEKVVSDRVNRSELKQKYEERVAEYSELMRKLVTEVKALEGLKRDVVGDGEDDTESKMYLISETEQNVEDLELRVELLGSELEDLRLKLPEHDENALEVEKCESAVEVVSGKSAPILRTLLLETMEKYSEAEVSRVC